MRVIVVFEYEAVEPNSPEADVIMETFFDRTDLDQYKEDKGATSVTVEEVTE